MGTYMDFVIAEQFQGLGWVIILAVLGGVNSFLRRYLDKGYPSTMSRWGYFFAFIHSILSSSLAGMVGFWGCKEFELSPHWTAIVVAISGHMGARWLSLAERIFVNRVNSTVGTGVIDPPKNVQPSTTEEPPK